MYESVASRDNGIESAKKTPDATVERSIIYTCDLHQPVYK
jgi:hypothetical protein